MFPSIHKPYASDCDEPKKQSQGFSSGTGSGYWPNTKDLVHVDNLNPLCDSELAQNSVRKQFQKRDYIQTPSVACPAYQFARPSFNPKK